MHKSETKTSMGTQGISYCDQALAAECSQIWQLCAPLHTIELRVEAIVKHLLQRPYEHLTTPLEGLAMSVPKAFKADRFEESMLREMATVHEGQASLSSFDCVTFVETVFAAAHAMQYNRADKFEKLFVITLFALRYYKGIDTFLFRNHLMEVDWLPNNMWMFKDITISIANSVNSAEENATEANISNLKDGKCAANTNHLATASAKIDKLSWLRMHKLMQGFNTSNISQVETMHPGQMSSRAYSQEGSGESIFQQRRSCSLEGEWYTQLEDLQIDGIENLNFNQCIATMPYIPSPWVLANAQVLSANFPQIAVVNIVRPGWDLTATIGTELNMSHLGVAVKDAQGVLQFYHASSVPNMVVCEPLTAYLEKYLDSPTIKGINILMYDA